jgi:hypothetical protein
MPRPCHPRPCHSSQGHGTAWPPKDALWANCQGSASSGYHAEFHEVIRSIPISDAGGQCETKHSLSWTRKILVAAHYKKDDLLHCWTSSRIFPATMRTFTKDTACRSRAGARHGMCELTHGMAGEGHGNGMLCVNRPLDISPHTKHCRAIKRKPYITGTALTLTDFTS